MYLSDTDRTMIRHAFFPLHSRIAEHRFPGRVVMLASIPTGLGPSLLARSIESNRLPF
jgi:hypothetical protein